MLNPRLNPCYFLLGPGQGPGKDERAKHWQSWRAWWEQEGGGNKMGIGAELVLAIGVGWRVREAH